MNTLTDALQLTDSPRLTPSQVATVENLARQRISEWWNRIGVEESYPTDDATAVRLVQSVDYVIDLESLVRFCDVGAIEGVAISQGKRLWSARDIVRLACFLECRRAWKPGSELHQAKKTAAQLAFENLAQSAEEFRLFNDLDRFDLRALLLMLTEAENRQQREILFVAVQIKLSSYCLTI